MLAGSREALQRQALSGWRDRAALNASDPKLKSFVTVAKDSHFPIQNLPYGVFTTPANYSPRVGVAIGDQVLDLSVLEQAGLLDLVPGERLFNRPTLNPFIERGPDAWRRARAAISDLLRQENARLRDDARLRARAFAPQSAAKMLLPLTIPGYTDFYSSKEHATNVGSMFRDPAHALLPNWLYVPIAYNGARARSSCRGTPVLRPTARRSGPMRSNRFRAVAASSTSSSRWRSSSASATRSASRFPSGSALSHVFGMVLMNDWSARDIQQWEYIPLGPFNSKTFATSISPWVVTMDALEPFRVEGPVQDPPPLPYLATTGPQAYDIHLEASLAPDGKARDDDLAHELPHDVLEHRAAARAPHGVGLQHPRRRPDGLGHVSGAAPDSYGSLLEITRTARGRCACRTAASARFSRTTTK